MDKLDVLINTILNNINKTKGHNKTTTMEQLTNLKHILHSKRANLFYLEHCRVMQK